MRVAQNLQQLWNEALESAHEVLQGTLLEREQAIVQREQALQSQTQQLTERERAWVARTAALEESLVLARAPLIAVLRGWRPRCRSAMPGATGCGCGSKR